MEFGEIEKINNLRDIWKHEEYDFSKWLSEEKNFKKLNNCIGIDMTLIETESIVGNFSIDILAMENGTNKNIIIENQLENSNNEHLGKIITYASLKSADIIIWIVKSANEEHIKTIEWLNSNTFSNIKFFLIEIEAIRISNSPIAINFNLIKKPSKLEHINNNFSNNELTNLNKLQLKYWKSFYNYCENKDINFKAVPKNEIYINGCHGNFQIKSSINSKKNIICVEIYINNNKDAYNKLKKQKNNIESCFNKSLKWTEADKDCRIISILEVDFRNEDDWNNQFKFFCDSIEKFKKIINDYKI